MIALPHCGLLPPHWRRGPEKWAPETIALAKLYASEGMGDTRVAKSLEFHGVSASVRTIRNWLRPRVRKGRATA